MLLRFSVWAVGALAVSAGGPAVAAEAAEAAAPVLTLDTALRQAREHAPQLLQARARTRAAEARVDQAGSGLWPQVQAPAS